MADVVLDADAVGQVITYVAPGYLAYIGYRTRYPAPSRPAGETLIIAVALSLPLVALVQALLPGDQTATQLGYVALLLGLACTFGYAAALVRGTQRVKSGLVRLGYCLQPEGTIYAQTLKHMSDEGGSVIELKDGRRIWGAVRSGPQTKDDGIKELYMVYPEQVDDDGKTRAVGAGIIVPLAEIVTVVLSEEPTAAPPKD